MSLNGLDNPAVLEAYQNALTEAGGWFLLNYVSRDEVALFERGTGGVPEVRNTLDAYEEKSPLYGFLHYRRRKLVLSFMPEGMSRLIQARTTVQFQSVLDKFSPHDTVFSLTKSTDLTESALSSACLLHAASGSITSSSSSLRRRRLMEITEDAEENAPGETESQAQPPAPDTRQRSASRLSDATVVPPPAVSRLQQTSTIDETSSITNSVIESPINEPGPSIFSDHTSERPASQRTFQDDLSRYDSRRSSQSARPSLRDIEITSTRKVKLGPRPSVDTNGRPRTAGGLARNQEQRPVASLPAGVRSSSLRKPSPNNVPRPRSQGSSVASPTRTGAPPVPPLLVPPLGMPISRPQISPGAKSLSAMSSSTGMSLEKERLMKALQQRKKQMEKRAGNDKKDQKKAQEEQKPPVVSQEDKENIDISGQKHKEEEPPAEPQSIAAPEPAEAPEELTPVVAEFSKPDSGVDIATSDSEERQPSDPSLPSNAATDMTDHDESSETKSSSPTPPATHQSETDALDRDSAVSLDSETNSGPSLSSAVEVPLENLSEKVPEEIIPPPKTLEEAPTPDEQEVKTPTNLPGTTPLPYTPTQDSDAATDPSTPVALNAPGPANDLTPEANQTIVVERKEKRKPYLEPIQVPTPEYSDDDNLLSDDSFMEELRSATFEEAKPVSVGKSPLSPVCSPGDDQSGPDAWRNSRAVSNPSVLGRQLPNLQTVAGNRSVSSPYGDLESPSTPVLVAKKINVSSGISKRIKALEKFTGTPSNSSQNLAAPPAASIEPFRKHASISLGVPNNDSASSSRHPSFSSEAVSRAPCLSRRGSQSSTNAQTTNSVSVTARIVRDPDATPDPKSDPFDSGVLNLQASPLTVEHETIETPVTDTEPQFIEPRERSASVSSATSSHQPSAPAIPPRSESRMSVSSFSRGDATSPKPTSDRASSPEDNRKESRASRLLRRMSSITSSSRKSVAGALSPSVKEEEVASPEPEIESRLEAPQAVDIGEVNVQFPDTLLWKRRFIRIDDKGFLVLTPANVETSNRNMVKRYHLSEFRTPCLPDEDRQELPNSILLDFLDGSTLQCACESRQGQESVLQTLVHAHGSQQQLA